MANQVTAPKGTKDILPADAHRWAHVEAVTRQLMGRYRYSEIRTPIFESTDLFQRGIGEGTDIVGKEMYTFEDKGERSLTLRPEGTAGVVRAYVEHKLFTQPAPQKVWYMGPMFRYERPQAGRQRQFHQIGVECLASADPRWDAEAIALATDLLATLGLPGLAVELNSVGCDVCRPAYRDKLQAYLRTRADELCADCHVRTRKNPLRALDCKVPGCQPMKADAPSLADSLCEECRTHHAAVLGYLEAVGIAYTPNEKLVRGLDYYTRTVFEITTTHPKLGSQNTVCAGGRYNKLVQELGGPDTPAVGWGLGMERLLILLGEDVAPAPGVFALVVATSGAPERAAFKLASDLRQRGRSVELGVGGKLDKQFKQAERLQARYALVLGEDELRDGKVAIKDLATRAQTLIPLTPEAWTLGCERKQSEEVIVVAGNIGSGKTTLTRYLSRYLGFTPSYESVDGNPYLADFYVDMERWSFPLQIYFLGKRFESHRAIVEGTESVIQDRSVYEDCAIFAENLRRTGKMTERDFQNYQQIYTIMGNYFRPPDLVVYLKASLGTLNKRIAKRGRDYEASIPSAYLAQLNGLYDEWIENWKLSPVVTLPADELDFVHSSLDCCSIFDLVEKTLDLPPMLPGLALRPERAGI